MRNHAKAHDVVAPPVVEPTMAARALHRLRRVGRTRGLARLRGVLQQRRSDVRGVGGLLRAAVALPLVPAGVLASRQVTRTRAGARRSSSFLLRYFPTHFDFLSPQLDAFRTARAARHGGRVALVWAALGVFSAVSSAVNHAWGVEKQRSFLRHKLFSFLMMLAAGFLLVLVLSARAGRQGDWFAASTGVPASCAGDASRPVATTLLLIFVSASSSTSCPTRRCGSATSGPARS